MRRYGRGHLRSAKGFRMTIVKVIGIEKFASIQHHIPNGIECDICGRQENWDRRDKEYEIARLRSVGWSGPMNNLETDPKNPDLCPACSDNSFCK